jgi:hypothetical protein
VPFIQGNIWRRGINFGTIWLEIKIEVHFKGEGFYDSYDKNREWES